MNSRGVWKGVGNALPAYRSWFAYELQIIFFPPRTIISSRFSSASAALSGSELQITQFLHASAQYNIQTKTQHFCRIDRLIIDSKRKPWWLLYMRVSGVRAFSCVVGAWHCQTRSLGCLTGARVWGFFCVWILSETLLWSHALSPADWDDTCFLSLSHCWQVPLTATWSPGAAVRVNRASHPGQQLD